MIVVLEEEVVAYKHEVCAEHVVERTNQDILLDFYSVYEVGFHITVNSINLSNLDGESTLRFCV